MARITKEEIFDEETLKLISEIKNFNNDKERFFDYLHDEFEENNVAYCHFYEKEDKANKLGFDKKSQFGLLVVSLIDYYIKNEKPVK
jgi:ribosomal protein S18 acetylase RimI-like enzyme